MSAAEGASEASSPEQANEWAVRANEWTDERVAQYFSLYSCLFQTTVQGRGVSHEVGGTEFCWAQNPEKMSKNSEKKNKEKIKKAIDCIGQTSTKMFLFESKTTQSSYTLNKDKNNCKMKAYFVRP